MEEYISIQTLMANNNIESTMQVVYKLGVVSGSFRKNDVILLRTYKIDVLEKKIKDALCINSQLYENHKETMLIRRAQREFMREFMLCGKSFKNMIND